MNRFSAAGDINDAMARRFRPGRDPVGKRFKLGSEDSGRLWFTIVGVVGDMRRQGPRTNRSHRCLKAGAEFFPACDPSRKNVRDDR